ncbi:MAG: hypothetical protein QW650_01150 [Thermofilum sp.]
MEHIEQADVLREKSIVGKEIRGSAVRKSVVSAYEEALKAAAIMCAARSLRFPYAPYAWRSRNALISTARQLLGTLLLRVGGEGEELYRTACFLPTAASLLVNSRRRLSVGRVVETAIRLSSTGS